MASSYTEVLAYIASLAGLKRTYEGLGSYTDQKAVVLSKNEGEYLYFYRRPFDKEMKNAFWAIFCTVTQAVSFIHCEVYNHS